MQMQNRKYSVALFVYHPNEVDFLKLSVTSIDGVGRLESV